MTIFNETDHPRVSSGQFAEKTQAAPELALERPYWEDQRRLAALGFPVSHDRAVIESYSVEPGIWRQAVSEPDVRVEDLNIRQRIAIAESLRILDSRRGRPAGSVSPWHRADCFAEAYGSIAVFLRSRAEEWTEDDRCFRVLIDGAGGVVDVREGVSQETGGILWNEL